MWLAYEDAQYEYVSLAGLLLFDLLGVSYFLVNPPILSLHIMIGVGLFILLMCYFGYRGKMGFGDVYAAIGCFFLAPDVFFLMMSCALVFCAVSLCIRQKSRIGFLPYMWSSFVITQLCGIALC